MKVRGILKGKTKNVEYAPTLLSKSELDKELTKNFHFRHEDPEQYYRRSKSPYPPHPVTRNKRWMAHGMDEDQLWLMTELGKEYKHLVYEFGALAMCKNHENVVNFREVFLFNKRYIPVVEIPGSRSLPLAALLKSIHRSSGPIHHYKRSADNQYNASIPISEKDGEKYKWTEAHVLYVLYEVLKGLVALHDKNIIHRDVKPENIQIDLTNGKLKIADFFYSTILTEEEPKSKKAIGDVYYMAPEVVRGNEYDQKADTWSFGIFARKVAENLLAHKSESNKAAVMKLIVKSKSPALHSGLGWTTEFRKQHTQWMVHNLSARPYSWKIINHKMFQKGVSQEEFYEYMTHFLP